MAVFTAAQDFDANRRTIATNEAFKTSKTIAFTGAAGLGAQGTTAIFTVTGDVLASVFAVCTEDLAGATATISLGLIGNTTAWIAATTATDLDANESWVDNAPGIGEAPTAVRIAPQGADITFTVATADITDGTLIFYCLWRPLSSDGNIVAA